MATILYAWELGGGLGHLVRMAPIFRNLLGQGHRIFAVVKDLSRVEKIFEDLDVTYLQAPTQTFKGPKRIPEPRSHAHILYNSGFADVDELRAMGAAWRNLFDLLDPDLILFDHAPTALLAARGRNVQRATIGNGFCLPPNVSTWPDFRPWLSDMDEQLKCDQRGVLSRANQVLVSWRQKPLQELSQLYHEVDENFLTTLPELDHYPERADEDYFGVWSTDGGIHPEWPSVTGKRIFCYLKNFSGLQDLLTAIRQSGAVALIYISGLDEGVRDRFTSPRLRFASSILNIDAVSSSCDLAILNGGLALTVSMLLAGRPIMSVPLCLEQAYNGSAVAKLEAGHGVLPENPEQFAPVLKMVLESERFLVGARRFSTKYANFDPTHQIKRISDRLNELVTE